MASYCIHANLRYECRDIKVKSLMTTEIQRNCYLREIN